MGRAIARRDGGGSHSEVLRHTEGAFSMLFLTPTELIAIRDPRGFRPLALGVWKTPG